MGYLAAAVVLVGVLCTLDLLLTVGVVRRLRAHTEQLSKLSSGASGPMPDTLLPVGASPAEFAATTSDGEVVSQDSLVGGTLVGFFMPDCPPCKEQLPEFVRYAAELAQGRAQALAVVVSEEGQAAKYVERLEAVARVVVEPHDGPVADAFSVRGFPAMCLLDADGVVTARAGRVEHLATSVPA